MMPFPDRTFSVIWMTDGILAGRDTPEPRRNESFCDIDGLSKENAAKYKMKIVT